MQQGLSSWQLMAAEDSKYLAAWLLRTHGKLGRGEGQLAQGKAEAGGECQDGKESPCDAWPVGQRLFYILGAQH